MKESYRSVLFVCLGNICRSPTAEGVFQHYAKQAGVADAVRVDSAGTGSWHVGERADRRMRSAASARGYSLESRSRQVVAEELSEWDLVVAMDQSNLEDLKGLETETAQIVLFSDFLSSEAPVDIPDPYYGGAEGFDRVIDLIEEGCPALLEHLLV